MSDGPEFLHVNYITYRVVKLSARCSNRLSSKAAGELKPEAYRHFTRPTLSRQDGLSPKGTLRTLTSRERSWEPVSASLPGGFEKGLEETPMRLMALIQKLGMPLYAEEKRVSGRLNGFDHAIGRHRTGNQAWSDLLD